MTIRDHKGFKIVTIGDIPISKLRKCIKSGNLSFTASELKGSSKKMLVHPANHKLIMSSIKKGKGLNGMMISAGEIKHDLELHKGGSVWSWLSNAGKSVADFASKNWDIIKPVLSKIGDVAIPALATAVGMPELGMPARYLTKELTGVGIKKTKKKKFNGGSFMIN